MGGSKARWIGVIIVLVLINYLVISSLFNLINKRSELLTVTPTRTAVPTWTPNAGALELATSTPTLRLTTPTAAAPTATSVGLSTRAPSVTATPAAPTAAPEPRRHTVKAGETLLEIAVQYGVGTDEILQLTNLQSADLVFAGQTLLIPPAPAEATGAPAALTPVAGTPPSAGTPAGTAGAPDETPAATPGEVVHVVQPGETLLDLSYLYKADMREIRRVNSLQGDWIYVGQKLIIPNPGQIPGVGPTATTVPGTAHTVAVGETLSTIAQRYGVSVEAIMNANNLPNPNWIYVGQSLVIPQP
ncbi:MAG: LysM peptidoglycan-binding domain-containing protein [Chloroflexi bacterium]|nr:LysM peptidoglycan-binding domain-containing protein [Chloroflexota bacterium]